MSKQLRTVSDLTKRLEDLESKVNGMSALVKRVEALEEMCLVARKRPAEGPM